MSKHEQTPATKRDESTPIVYEKEKKMTSNTLTRIGVYELNDAAMRTVDGRFELRQLGVANPSDKPGTYLYDHRYGSHIRSKPWGFEGDQLIWMDGYNVAVAGQKLPYLGEAVSDGEV